MKKILVPIDFSDVTDLLIDAAKEQARFCDGELYLLHVEAPDPDFMGYDPGPQWIRDGVAHDIKKHHHKLDAIKDNLQKEGVNIKAFLLQGPTVSTILDEAQRIKADLIVIGTHGHKALHDLLLGSVSEGVVRAAPCPVLIIHSRMGKQR